MNARAIFRTKRASGMLGSAVALLLISAACSGLLWAIAGGEASQDRHPNGGATIVERSGQGPTEDPAVNQPACFSHSLRRMEASTAGDNHWVRSRGFSAVPLSPFAAYALALQGKKINDPAPDFANRGRKFNPQGEVVGPLAIDPVQKVLVIFVEFTTPPHTVR